MVSKRKVSDPKLDECDMNDVNESDVEMKSRDVFPRILEL